MGPQRAVQPIGKFTREELNQSPLVLYRKEEKEPGTLDMSKVSAKIVKMF